MVDGQLNAHEEFIGLYSLPSTEAETIVSVLKDVLLRLNLSMKKIRGRCYGGASSMSGIKTGVAKQIRDIEPRAFYTHCYGHSLNLAASDTLQKCKLMKSALEVTHEMTKLIKLSPRREHLFREIKDQLAPDCPGVRVLCPTRWTVRADSLKSIVTNYTAFDELWDSASTLVRDTEMIARIRGVAAQMKVFDFFYGLVLGELLLRHSDNLSRALQHSSISAAEGQVIAKMTLTTLRSTLRCDDSFNLFLAKSYQNGRRTGGKCATTSTPKKDSQAL